VGRRNFPIGENLGSRGPGVDSQQAAILPGSATEGVKKLSPPRRNLAALIWEHLSRPVAWDFKMPYAAFSEQQDLVHRGPPPF